MFGTVCHLKLLILAYYDYLKELLSLWIFRIFRNVFSFLIMLCACVRVCFSVFFLCVCVCLLYVWAAVSAGYRQGCSCSSILCLIAILKLLSEENDDDDDEWCWWYSHVWNEQTLSILEGFSLSRVLNLQREINLFGNYWLLFFCSWDWVTTFYLNRMIIISIFIGHIATFGNLRETTPWLKNFLHLFRYSL